MSVVTPPPSAERRKPIGPSFSKSSAKWAATYARFRVVGTDSSSSDNRTKTPVGSDILRRNRPAASPLRGQNPMKPRKIPRGTFWIGGLAALALGLPLTTLALAFLAERLHIGRPDATQAQIGTMAAIFAGLPA